MARASTVLFVDDDSNWVELLRMAFDRAGTHAAVKGVTDGAEALSYLRGEGPYADRALHPLPALVLLDLRLPGMNGFEVLRWIRGQPEFAGLRVVVITGMATPSDARRARELGANALLAKPFSFTKLVEMAGQIRDAWLQPDGRQTPPKED